MDYSEKIKRLSELILKSDNAYALTGAGLSTESGIPDFRSPGTGLWEKINPMLESSKSALERNPARFYDINLARWRNIFENAEPNLGHKVLALMEKTGLLKGIATQNTDGLHIKAGSKNVYELHGHVRTCRCINCYKEYSFEELTSQYDKGINPPLCPSEKCKGVLRPSVVLFEDSMPNFFEKVVEMMFDVDLLLVVGTSLGVYPVAALPEYTKRFVIINLAPTPLDDKAELVFNEPTGKVFGDLWSQIKNLKPEIGGDIVEGN